MSNVYNKDYKFFMYNWDGFFATGRIKRVRSRRVSRYEKRLKRLVKSLDIFNNSNIFYPLTRWNRH